MCMSAFFSRPDFDPYQGIERDGVISHHISIFLPCSPLSRNALQAARGTGIKKISVLLLDLSHTESNPSFIIVDQFAGEGKSLA